MTYELYLSLIDHLIYYVVFPIKGYLTFYNLGPKYLIYNTKASFPMLKTYAKS